MQNQSRPVKILSMDGGGLGGLITARILQSIAQTIPGFLEDIDLIAGTSAGAVNALILAQYEDPVDGLEACIRLWQEPTLLRNTLWGTLLATCGLGPFISADNYQSILQRYIDPQWTLEQLKKNVLISTFLVAPVVGTAWDIRNLVNWRPRALSQSALDAALYSSAAPMLQAIHQGYIDGGMFNASPAISALAHMYDLLYACRQTEPEQKRTNAALESFCRRLKNPSVTFRTWKNRDDKPGADSVEEDVLLLSVGCGYGRRTINVSRTGPTPWGALQWMVPSPVNNFTIFGTLLLDAQTQIVNADLKEFALAPYFKYQRVEPLLNLGLLAYNFAALNPFLRAWVIGQLETACQTPATVKRIQETIDWLYETGWSRQRSDASTAGAPDDDKR